MNTAADRKRYVPELPPAVDENACPYCAGKGGRHRMVASRFAGTEYHAHEGPWEACWSCGGTGLGSTRG